jgi:hypothetical protein
MNNFRSCISGILIFIVCSCHCCFPLLSAAQQKYGLIVTVGEFLKPDQAKDSVVWYPKGLTPLKCPSGDLKLMRKCFDEVLEIPVSNTKYLMNEQASKDAILDALWSGIDNAVKGDVFYFYFSGHGSQFRNKSSKEFDHLDEAILPYDAVIKGHVIRDKELADILSYGAQKGMKIIAIIDCCHSGTLSRDIHEEVKSVPSPELDMDVAARATSNLVADYLVISSARGDQVSKGIPSADGQYYSVFTKILYEELSRQKIPLAVDELISKCNARLMVDNQDQRAVVQVPSGRRNQSIEGNEIAWMPECVVVHKMGAKKWLVSGKSVCRLSENDRLEDPESGRVFWVDNVLSATEAVIISKSSDNFDLRSGKNLVPDWNASSLYENSFSVYLDSNFFDRSNMSSIDPVFADKLSRALSGLGSIRTVKDTTEADARIECPAAARHSEKADPQFSVSLHSEEFGIRSAYQISPSNVDSVIELLIKDLSKLSLFKTLSEKVYIMPEGLRLQVVSNNQRLDGASSNVKNQDRIDIKLFCDVLSAFDKQYYAYLYGLSSDGSIKLIFPIGGINDENRIHSGAFNSEGFCNLTSYKVGPPYGKDRILLYLTEIPMSNPQLIEQNAWSAAEELSDWVRLSEQPLSTRSVEQLASKKKVYGQRIELISGD